MASIDTLSIELTASTAKASAELDKLTGKLNILNKSLAKTGLSSGLAGIGQAFLGMSSALPRLTMGLGKFASVGRNTTKATKGMSSSIASLYANIWSLSRIAEKAFTGIKGSMDLIETYHYFDVAMSKIGEQSKDAWREHGKSSAEEYADSFRERSVELNQKMSGFTFDRYGIPKNTGTKSLGMDPDLVMQYQAQYAQMADSIGMTGEAALATSEAMTMLAGDWSSLRNLEFNDSFQKMASALAGQSRAVRSLGIDITQAALQQTAYNIGLKTSVTNMDQATKAELRMITILDQSRVAWGDLANTINTPANQLRMIKQNFISLARTIGNIFLPIVGKVLPYINGLVIALQRLAEWLAGFLGVDLKNTIGSMGGLDNDILGDLADDAGETAENLDDADKKAKELKKTILGFDELHVLNDNKEDEEEGKGTTGINGLGAGEQALLDAALNDLLDEYKKVWDKAFADMNSKAEEFAKKLEEIATKIRDFVKNGEFEKLGEYLASGINFVLDKAAEAINADKVLGKLYPVIDAITTTFNSMVDNIDFDKIGSILANGINIISGVIRRFADGIDEFNLGQKLADAFNALLRDVDWSGIGNTLASLLNSLWDLVRGFVKKLDATKLGNALGNLFDGLNDNIKWAEIGDTIELGFNKFWTALRSFFLDRDRFYRLGENFATLLNHAISIRNFSLAGETIALAFNDLFATLKGFIDRFDWDNLASAMKAGFKAFVKNINITEAAEILNETVLSLLGTIRKAIDKNDWHALGEDIGNAFKAIDWATYLKMGIDIIKDTLGELFIGAVKGAFGDFGENFARGFVEGISDVLKLDVEVIKAVGGALEKFAEALGKLSPTLVRDLGKALGFFFGIKITGNIASAIANVVTQLLKLKGVISGGTLVGGAAAKGAAKGGILSGAVKKGVTALSNNKALMSGLETVGSAAFVGNAFSALPWIAKDIQGFFETLEGKNGIVTEIGTAWEETIRKMTDAGVLLKDDGEKLLTYIDELETQGLSYDEISKKVIEKLGELGISSDQITQNVTQNAKDTGYALEEAADSITKNAGLAGDGWSKFAETFNVKGTSIQNDADAMRTLIHDSLLEIDTSLTGNTRMWQTLDEIIGQSTGNSQEKFQQFCTVLKDQFGWSDEQINTFITKMKENFPEGVASGTSKAVQSLQNFSVGASTEYKKVDGSVSEVIKKILGIGPAAEDADSRSKGLQAKLKGWTSPISGLLKGLSLWATGEGVEGVGTKSEKAQPKVENFDTTIQSIDKDDKGKNSIGDIALGFKDVGTASGDMIPVVDENMFKLTTTLESKGTEVRKDAKTIADNLTLGFAEDVRANTPQVTDAISDSMGDTIATAKRELGINSPSTVFADIGANVLRGFINGIGDQISSLKMTMSSVVYYIKQPFDGVARDIVSTFNGLGYNISRAAGNLYDVGRGMGSSLAAGFSSFRITLPHFGWDWSRIPYGNGGWFDIPNIWVRWYAKGGVFTDPTIAGFGEAGTEAALPLTNKHTMAMVSDAIVNSGGALSNGMSREDVIEAVATGVAMAMGQNPQTVEVVVNSVLKTSDEKLAQSVSRGQARLNQRYNVAH